MSDQKTPPFDDDGDDEEKTKVTRVTTRRAEPQAKGTASLVVVSVPFDDAVLAAEVGRRIPIGRSVTIGRHPDNKLVLEQDEVSRRHAEVFLDDGRVRVRDLGSRNGTLVNDQDLRGTIRTLVDGDRITVGTVILKFIESDTENKFHELIYRLKVEDALTGAHNKRYLMEFLEREVARASRHQGALSLVIYDVDHFKRINDTFGHLAGDAVLRESSGLVKEMVRREDCFARYGGEEFCLVLPDVRADGAAVLAERIRARIADHRFEFNGVHIPVTVSLGSAQLPPDVHDCQAFLALADERLYRAKHAGRNRVVVG
jgi:diguanylate cyclase (GGDEF)-like protein